MNRYRRRLIKFFSSVSVLLAFSSGTFCQEINSGRPDTLYISYPDSLPLYIHPKHQYHQILTMKLFMAQALYDERPKKKDNGISTLYLNCEQSLDIIRRIDNLTLGMPKIVYLVGWQYNGHDSKYPAWFEGNESVKRPADPSAIESIKWLMKEAEKFHTTVSLHINMFDAYEDSPLWETYVRKNIIARNKDSTLRHAEWGYPVSYAQEWKTGYAKKRIDTICRLLPIEKAGTVHIDAFHTWPPIPVKTADGRDSVDLSEGPVSPLLGYTPSDESEAQKKIFLYWSSKGIDVTSEGVDFLRQSAFEGYQHMAWWFGGKSDHYLKWPASYYCGGMDNSKWGKLFGTSIHGEDLVKNDPQKLAGFKEQFCLKTAVWYYLNRLQRIYFVNGKDFSSVTFSDNVKTFLTEKEYRITKGEMTLLENGDVFIPALWMGPDNIIAYSRNGYKNKRWILPSDWTGIPVVRFYRVTDRGVKEIGIVPVVKGTITLTLKRDDMILIEKESIRNNNRYRQLLVTNSE